MFGNFSGGAANDIEKGYRYCAPDGDTARYERPYRPDKLFQYPRRGLPRQVVCRHQQYIEAVAAKIDAEIQRIITEAYQRAKQLLTENIEKLKFIAEFLIKNEVMDADQFKRTMESTPTFEELEEIAAEKKRRRAEANREKARRDADSGLLAAVMLKTPGRTPRPIKRGIDNARGAAPRKTTSKILIRFYLLYSNSRKSSDLRL